MNATNYLKEQCYIDRLEVGDFFLEDLSLVSMGRSYKPIKSFVTAVAYESHLALKGTGITEKYYYTMNLETGRERRIHSSSKVHRYKPTPDEEILAVPFLT